MPHYEVNVGNIGFVHRGEDKAEAVKEYECWVAMSDGDMGRASGEDVTLFEDGEPIKEHVGFLNKEER